MPLTPGTRLGDYESVVNVATRERTRIDVRLTGRSIGDMFALSPDNRTLYYGTSRTEADIWIVERK